MDVHTMRVWFALSLTSARGSPRVAGPRLRKGLKETEPRVAHRAHARMCAERVEITREDVCRICMKFGPDVPQVLYEALVLDFRQGRAQPLFRFSLLSFSRF